MLTDCLLEFNRALTQFQEKFPRNKWTEKFRTSLINDYSFYSSRYE